MPHAYGLAYTMACTMVQYPYMYRPYPMGVYVIPYGGILRKRLLG